MIYDPNDYVGLFRHLVIFAIDGMVVWFGLVVIAILFTLVQQMTQTTLNAFKVLAMLIFVWWYLTALKRSQFRTLGYWLTGVRIVTLYGEPPTLGRMTLRVMLLFSWVFGYPIDVFTDFVWTTMGDDRQMFRDVMSGTRLIRGDAKPIGYGQVNYCLWTGLGRTFFYARVRPVQGQIAVSSGEADIA